MSADDVRESWRRIDAWLAQHAPRLAGWLRPPATAAQIAAAEADAGVRFPDELRASLEVHDGQVMGSEVLGEWGPLGCTDLVGVIEFLRTLPPRAVSPEVAAVSAAPGVRPAWWHPAWIPFAGNGGGDLLVADADPLAGGRPEQVILYLHDLERRDVIASGLAAWLSAFADALEADQLEVMYDGDALWPRARDY